MRKSSRIILFIAGACAVLALAGCKPSNDLQDPAGFIPPCEVSILKGMDPVWMFQNGYKLPCPDHDNDGIPNEEDVDLTLGEDCNGNGVDDLFDIDEDQNGFVDECENCDNQLYYNALTAIIQEEFDANVEEGVVSNFIDLGFNDAANCKPRFSSVQDQLDVMIDLWEAAEENGECFVAFEMKLFIDLVVSSYEKGFGLGMSECNDHDGDGVPDECDMDLVVGQEWLDCDSNGIIDSCEPDTDGDGITDACDDNDDRVCPYHHLECDDDDHQNCRDKNGKKVWVLHNGRPLHISANALQAHLDHGDTLLECED